MRDATEGTMEAADATVDVAALCGEVKALRVIVGLLTEALAFMPAHATTTGPTLGAGLLDGVGARLAAAGDHGVTRFALRNMLQAQHRQNSRILAPLGAAMLLLEREAEVTPDGLLLATPALANRVRRVRHARDEERERRQTADARACSALATPTAPHDPGHDDDVDKTGARRIRPIPAA